MKARNILLLTLAGITMAGGAATAQQEPERPVLEAALKATPSNRLEARRFVLKAYPELPGEVYTQLKTKYPNLEHGVIDAGLTTWEQHPGEVLGLAHQVKEQFGPRLKAVREAVRTEMDESYPDFQNRLKGVLEKHGIGPRYRAFMTGYAPGHLESVRGEVKGRVPESRGWYPGKIRDILMSARPGESPVLDRLSGIVEKNPEMAPKLARKMVEKTRRDYPQLAEDLARHFLQDRGRLRDALEAEFPGFRGKVVAIVTTTDSTLPGEVAQFVRTKNRAVRDDFRSNLEKELPGLETMARTTVEGRYPELKEQLLRILRG